MDRRLFEKVNQRLELMPTVAILGPHQAGKTTLAMQIADKQPSLYLDLQLESDRARLDDPGPYLKEHRDKLIILDEIHRVPGLVSTLEALSTQIGGQVNVTPNLSSWALQVPTYFASPVNHSQEDWPTRNYTA